MEYIQYSDLYRGWRTFDSVRYKRFFCSPNRADCFWAHPPLSSGAEVNHVKHQPEYSIFWPGFELDYSLIKKSYRPVRPLVVFCDI